MQTIFAWIRVIRGQNLNGSPLSETLTTALGTRFPTYDCPWGAANSHGCQTMEKPRTTPLPQRIEEASRAIRRRWSYEERCARRRAAPRRQLKLLRAVLASNIVDSRNVAKPTLYSPFAIVG